MKSLLAFLLLLGAAAQHADATSAPQAAATNVQEVLVAMLPDGIQAAAPAQRTELKPQARSAVEHFTLGAKIEGDVPIFSYSNTINYDSPQDIMAEVSYPKAAALEDSATPPSDAIITQIEAHVEGSVGMECQAYVMDGGIGEKSLTLQLVASNTESLRYVVVIYGNKV